MKNILIGTVTVRMATSAWSTLNSDGRAENRNQRKQRKRRGERREERAKRIVMQAVSP
jgi:hypothetical protein